MIRINTDKVGRKRKIHGDAGGKNGRYNIHEQGIILLAPMRLYQNINRYNIHEQGIILAEV